MTRLQISNKLKEILEKYDIDVKEILSRKRHHKYDSEIDMLLDHLSTVMSYLKFDSEASRREVIRMAQLIRDSGNYQTDNDNEGTSNV